MKLASQFLYFLAGAVISTVLLAPVFYHLGQKNGRSTRLARGEEHVMYLSDGSPLVGAREDKTESNVVVWKRQRPFMIVTFKNNGGMEWDMTLSDGSQVFDWNGDGQIDERAMFNADHSAIQSREVFIDGKFWDLSVQDGKFWADGKLVEKKNGTWHFVAP